MSRSIVRIAAVALGVIALPAISSAQLTCNRINGVSSAGCQVTAAHTIPTLAGVAVGATGLAFAAPSYNNLFAGTDENVTTSTTISFVANTTYGVTIVGGLVTDATGSTRTVNGHYLYQIAANCSAGSYTPVPTTAAAMVGTPGTASASSGLNLCLRAFFDADQPASYASGTYTLTVTLVVTGP